MPSDIMVDLETFSTRSNASVLTIGAIAFDRHSEKMPRLEKCLTFYRRIDRDSCKSVGLHEDKETLEWWKRQSKEARHEVFTSEDRVSLRSALVDFERWLKSVGGSLGSIKVWGHGSVFDCTILENAYLACGLKCPWRFWNVRDTRTLFDVLEVGKEDMPSNGAHHALHDCYRQVVGVKKAVGKLEYSGESEGEGEEREK